MFWFELPYSIPSKRREALPVGISLLGSPKPERTTPSVRQNPTLPPSGLSSSYIPSTPGLTTASQPTSILQNPSTHSNSSPQPPPVRAVDFQPPPERPALTITESELPLLPDSHGGARPVPTEEIIASTFPSTYTEGYTPGRTPISPEIRGDADPFESARPVLQRGSSDSGRTKTDSPPMARPGLPETAEVAVAGPSAPTSAAPAPAAAAAAAGARMGVDVPNTPGTGEGPLCLLVVDDDK